MYEHVYFLWIGVVEAVVVGWGVNTYKIFGGTKTK